jgi:peptidoglycan/xylan/chitin deacetylase (PgdA/CDA1 family)
MERKVAILGFHKIGDSPPDWYSWFYIPEPVFAEQLEHLQRTGWEVLDIGRFLRGLSDPGTLPPRSALLTFDDGYRSMLHAAAPRLERFGFPAVLFVPTAYIGLMNLFDGDNEPEEPICSWEELRELERRGISVQSHAVTHRTFSELGPAELERELVESKQLLERGLEKPVEVFSYPFGDEGAEPGQVRELLSQAGYRAACVYGGSPVSVPVADVYGLPRLAMGPDTDLAAELQQLAIVPTR